MIFVVKGLGLDAHPEVRSLEHVLGVPLDETVILIVRSVGDAVVADTSQR